MLLAVWQCLVRTKECPRLPTGVHRSLAAGEGEGEGDGGATAALHQHLLVEFALSLLQGALRKGLINPRAPGAGAVALLLFCCGMPAARCRGV